MSRRDQNLQDSLNKRAREMSPRKDNDEPVRHRRTHTTTQPRITEPDEEPILRPVRPTRIVQEPTYTEFDTIGQPVQGINMQAHDMRPTQMFAMPRAPAMRTENWVPGRTTRTGHIDSHGQPRMREEVEEGNLMHMTYVANRQFEDAQQARQTMERIQRRAERAAYRDRESQRMVTQKLQLEHNNKVFMDREQQRLSHERQQMDAQRRAFKEHREDTQSQERMKMYANKREYDDRENERQTLARIERERMEHERKQAEIKHRAAMEKEREIARQRQQELDHMRHLTLEKERFKIELEKAKQQELRRQREAEALLQISGLKLGAADREAQRKHEEHMAALDRLDQLVRASDTLADNAQQRRFNEVTFRDSRVGKHERYVKLEREQSGLNHISRLRKAFRDFDMDAPEDEDLNIPQLTPPQILLERRSRSGYIHSFLVIGAIGISRANPNRPTAVFLDGSQVYLPSWNDGFLIHAEHLDRTVWLVHVHQAPYTMPVQEDNEESESDDYLCGKNWCRLCNVQ